MADESGVRVEETDPGETFKHWMSKAVKCFRDVGDGITVPGVAVAVVGPAGGSTFHFGHLEDDPNSPEVTKDTMFAVGSVTKVFTATLLAWKVQNGDWSLTDMINVPYISAPTGDLGQ